MPTQLINAEQVIDMRITNWQPSERYLIQATSMKVKIDGQNLDEEHDIGVISEHLPIKF